MVHSYTAGRRPSGLVGRLKESKLHVIRDVIELPVMDENGFAAEDLAQAYNKNCMNRHVILFL